MFASQNVQSWDEVREFVPVHWVNFDERRILSMYHEMISFEDHAPTGWKAEWADFLSLIPESDRYWIRDDEDMFAKLYSND